MAKRKSSTAADSPAAQPLSKRPTRAKGKAMASSPAEEPLSKRPTRAKGKAMASSTANDPPPAAAEPLSKRPTRAKGKAMASSPANQPPLAGSKGPTRAKSKASSSSADADVADEPDEEAMREAEIDEMEDNIDENVEVMVSNRRKPQRRRRRAVEAQAVQPQQEECELLEPFTIAESRDKWPHRYQTGSDKASSSRSIGNDDDELKKALLHYGKARIDGVEFKLNDDALVQGEEGKLDFICKIIEIFRGVDKVMYFRACWYYRAEDTVISEVHKNLVDDQKRVFLSEMENDNIIDCLVKPLNIAYIPLDMDSALKESIIAKSDFYYDQVYLLPHCTFICPGRDAAGDAANPTVEVKMLDLYAGCGAMSTGLCIGSNLEGVRLVTKWAVDNNEYACESLRKNHPETEVRHESAEDFLQLLKEWEQICASYKLMEGPSHPVVKPSDEDDVEPSDDEESTQDDAEMGGEETEQNDAEIFEVEEVIGICFGEPNEKDRGLYFKVRWAGYDSDFDTWEPFNCLSGCPTKLKEFILNAFHKKLLPLPGYVDVLCGGPPCQGISGFNRYRNVDDPLSDPKNQQMRVYMDIVEYLKPRFVLMENVVDLFRFCQAHLGRYAFARLVQMRYQARLGLIAAGGYGLAQYRMRAFVWAAIDSEKLPQFPLPTHDVVARGNPPTEFQDSLVGFEVGSEARLQKRLSLGDVISDLPPVSNKHTLDEMDYTERPFDKLTAFQKAIRLRKYELPGFLQTSSVPEPPKLFDHRPLRLNADDLTRVGLIPQVKGANFRNLPQVKVSGNVAHIDLSEERRLLKSGKPLVPQYALSFVKGTSCKPFGRLWWDETVSTVVGRAEPHNQAILHPEQDRVLTIRENARLQGFPDFYKLEGPVKQRYIQVGNAVAIPVARALGHSLALAIKGISGSAPLYQLPRGFH